MYIAAYNFLCVERSPEAQIIIFFSKKWPVYSYINGKLRLGVEFGFAALVVLLVLNSRTRSNRAQGHQARCHQARCKLVQEALQTWYQMCLIDDWVHAW